MTSEELQQARTARWLALRPEKATPAALRTWVGEIGFVDAPEIEAWAPEALGWLENELAALRLIELAVWPGVFRYASAEILDYIYAAIGDRHPRRDFRRQAQRGQITYLAAEVYDLLLAAPSAMSAEALRDQLGAERISLLAVERALAELRPSLKVVRVGPDLWRPLVAARPEVATIMDRVSLSEAVAALVSQWLDVRVCDTEAAIAAYFAPLFARSRVHDALMALETQRQLAPDSLDGQPAFRLAKARVS